MAESKEEILANFQSITGIEDIGEAFSHMEDAKWDLMAAIQRVMPSAGNNIAETKPTNIEVDTNDDDTKNILPSSSSSREDTNAPRWDVPSTSANVSRSVDIIDLTTDYGNSNYPTQAPKDISFTIHFNQGVYYIKMPPSSTIGHLKRKVLQLTNVPVCRQLIQGWPPEKSSEANLNISVLSTLNLSDENELILQDITYDGLIDTTSDRSEETFVLNIVQQPEAKTITLNVEGKQTILDVKTNIYYITDIPVRNQEWSGWPVGTNNSTKLMDARIESVHNFIIHKINKSNRNDNVVNVDTDSSADEFEDASEFNAYEEYFTDSPPVPAQSRHLIPNNVDDESLGSIQFVENYIQKFGEPHPVFTGGSLEDVLKIACHKPAKERKLLAIYLHHGDSILTNVFCDTILKHEGVIQALEQSFILYGWDLTFESNKNLFLSSVTACVSNTASITVRNMPIDKLPAMIIVGKTRLFGRSACEVLFVIHGNVGLDDFLCRLMESVEVYSQHIKEEILEENERAARDLVKIEQDIAYQETLEADMAKEAAKEQKEMALAAERQRLQSEKAEEDAKRESIRLEAELALPEEPYESVEVGITHIRARGPDGVQIERKFYQTDTLHDLLNFVASKGYLIQEYKVISNWPRRDLTALLNLNETLEDLKLCPQETVILEER